MKVIVKPIEMICLSNENGITPLRFRIQEDKKYKVVKVEKVLNKRLEKLCGNLMWIFDCQSTIDNAERLFQLKYDIGNCKWILFKM